LNNTNRRAQDIAAAVRFLIPVGLALLIGLRLPVLDRATDQRLA
jgi:hypothetical protein